MSVCAHRQTRRLDHSCRSQLPSYSLPAVLAVSYGLLGVPNRFDLARRFRSWRLYVQRRFHLPYLDLQVIHAGGHYPKWRRWMWSGKEEKMDLVELVELVGEKKNADDVVDAENGSSYEIFVQRGVLLRGRPSRRRGVEKVVGEILCKLRGVWPSLEGFYSRAAWEAIQGS